MQISGILKFKPMPGTPTNPLLRQILRWVVWSQIPSIKKKEDSVRFFSWLESWTSDILLVTLTFLSGIGQRNGKSQNCVCVGWDQPSQTDMESMRKWSWEGTWWRLFCPSSKKQSSGYSSHLRVTTKRASEWSPREMTTDLRRQAWSGTDRKNAWATWPWRIKRDTCCYKLPSSPSWPLTQLSSSLLTVESGRGCPGLWRATGWHFLDPGLLSWAWRPLALKSRKKKGKGEKWDRKKVDSKRNRLKGTKRDGGKAPGELGWPGWAWGPRCGDVRNIYLNSGGGKNKRGGRCEGVG